MSDDQIPTIGRFRNVGLHDNQSPKRLRTVKAEISLVLDRLNDAEMLAEFAADASHSPEARMTAGAKARAMMEAAKAEREVVAVKLRDIDAAVAGLDKLSSRNPLRYCADEDSDFERAVLRERPLK